MEAVYKSSSSSKVTYVNFINVSLQIFMDLRFNLCYLDISQRVVSHRRTIYLRQKANNWVSLDYRDLSKCQADIGLLCQGSLVFNFWLWLLVRNLSTLMTSEATTQSQCRALTKPHKIMLKGERRIQPCWILKDWFHSKTMIMTKP